MRISRPAVLLASGVLASVAAAPAQAAPPAGTGNCVSFFTATLGQAGAAGVVIRGGAQDPALAPFGRNAVSVQAHGELGSCLFDPGDFPLP